MQHGEFPGNARQRDPGIRPGHETPCQKGKGTPMLDRITLITGNAGKAAEYAAMLGIEVTPAKAKLTEVQAIDVARAATPPPCPASGPAPPKAGRPWPRPPAAPPAAPRRPPAPPPQPREPVL